MRLNPALQTRWLGQCGRIAAVALVATAAAVAAQPDGRPPLPRPFDLPSDARPGPEAGPATRPATAPSTGPAATRPATTRGAATRAVDPAKRQQDAQRLFDHLMAEYRKSLDASKDRLGRSLVVVCVARVPRADATALLLDVLKKDKDPLVQMVAWQSLLARAGGLEKGEYDQWLELTMPLAAKGAFRGDLRVGLLRLLAAGPPDARAKQLLGQCFAGTNSQDVADLPTIVAMGQTVRAWRDPLVVESFLRRLATPDDAIRAEAVLHAAGCDVLYAGEWSSLGSKKMWQVAMGNYAEWWQRQRPNWTPAAPVQASGKVPSGKAAAGKAAPGKAPEKKVAKGKPAPAAPPAAATAPAEAWRAIEAQYVPAPDFSGSPDPEDPTWHKDLELRPPELKGFEVAFVVDASGSMQEVITWLRADVRRVMDALALAYPQPQIGITFYRDAKDAFVTRTVPLTRRVDHLALKLSQVEAKGGGDQPEAVREGLAECLKSSPWAPAKQARKALVLIGDAPPQPNTQAECERMVAAAAEAGFRLYAVKVKTGWEAEDLSAFDRLAYAGNGRVLHADLRFGPSNYRFRWWLLPGARVPGFLESEQAKLSADARLPGEDVIAGILSDAVSPEYQERVRPVACVLWQMLKEPTPEKHGPFPPADDTRVSQPKKPFDPQKER